MVNLKKRGKDVVRISGQRGVGVGVGWLDVSELGIDYVVSGEEGVGWTYLSWV